MLSVISLLGIKALYDSLITVANTLFSLLARTLQVRLYITLHKLIGLNSVISWGDFTFGQRHIYVSFKLHDILPELREERTQLTTSGLIIFQQCLKKIGDIPSSSGAFVGCIYFRAYQTSSASKSASCSSFMSVETRVVIELKLASKQVGWSDL